MISQFRFQNFKSYHDATLPLANLTVMIGANASGKTNALEGKAPYTPIRSDFFDDIPTWLSSFPDNAMRKISFADTTIISEFDKQCTLNPQRRVYIWAYDGDLSSPHLSSYNRLDC